MIFRLSYFNPLSHQHHALAESKHFPSKIRAGIWIASTVVGMLTFGVGGVALFRYLTGRMTKHLSAKASKTGEKTEKIGITTLSNANVESRTISTQTKVSCLGSRDPNEEIPALPGQKTEDSGLSEIQAASTHFPKPERGKEGYYKFNDDTIYNFEGRFIQCACQNTTKTVQLPEKFLENLRRGECYYFQQCSTARVKEKLQRDNMQSLLQIAASNQSKLHLIAMTFRASGIFEKIDSSYDPEMDLYETSLPLRTEEESDDLIFEDVPENESMIKNAASLQCWR